MQHLQGAVAIVTGASSGIGQAIARRLATDGAAVVVHYNSGEAPAEELVATIIADGGRGIAVHADVSREEDVRALFARCIAAFGRVDILVANSGIQKDAAIGDMTLDDWNAVIGVDLTGQFLCCREAIRCFRAQDAAGRPFRARGSIVSITSIHDRVPWAGHANYAASKGGISMLMKTLAQEVAAERIRVNAIAPGAIRTPINRAAWEEPEALRKLLTLVPYGRIGEVEDVAEAAAWLVSDRADYVTGTTLYIDGGATLYPDFRDNG